jgi:hypothetical protein
MANQRLKTTIIETVCNQIENNEPPKTRIAYNRLISEGYSDMDAKEAIGAVVLENIYEMLKNNRLFDEDDFSERLDNMLNNMEKEVDPDDSSDDSEQEINVIFKMIELNFGHFPEQELTQLIQSSNDTAPMLIRHLESVRDYPDKYMSNDNYVGCIYAVYLLAQFKAEEALPVLIDIVSLPDDSAFDLLGDVITEDLGRILASLCGGKTKAMKKLIENSTVNEYVRCQATDALAIMALHDSAIRDEVIWYFRKILDQTIRINHPRVLAEVVNNCTHLYAIELLPEIKSAYKKGLIDKSQVTFDDVEQSFALSRDEVLDESINVYRMQYITDTIGELSTWACFTRDVDDLPFRLISDIIPQFDEKDQTPIKFVEIKAGRNDPCPCGSGKKFKKCCGKNSSV